MNESSVTDMTLIAGYAKLPSNITSEEVYKILAVVVVTDMHTGEITEAECSVVTTVAKNFVASLMKGYNMNDGSETLIQRFDTLYHGQAKKAIETSIKMIFSKYDELKHKIS